ncbi:MAG: diguanylate cyclase [Thermodesulfovibrio sp.]|nr:diguanylate cyclase [Thermodesulfovibrio sp.]
MLSHLKIKTKLAIFLGLSAALALLISSLITLFTTYIEQKQDSLNFLNQLTNIISENMRAALAFHDRDAVAKLLLPLKVNPHILLAIVRDENENILGTYTAEHLSQEVIKSYSDLLLNKQTSHSGSHNTSPKAIEEATFSYMFVIKPIYLENRKIGSIAILTDNSKFRMAMGNHLVFQFIASFVSLMIILIFSIKLQKLFTSPILNLLDIMDKISATKDYNLQATSTRQDEFGHLYKGFNNMITEIRQRDEKLESLSTTDALTGIFNRRYAYEQFHHMIIKSVRKKEPIGVLMIDIDFFKKINDNYGHHTGDMVLKEIAQILLHCARQYDIIARIGGEEFLILCDNSDYSVTRSIAERVRKKVEAHDFVLEDGRILKITVSIGAYSIIPENMQIDEILKIVDDLLYTAKKGGRNRVEMGLNQ